MDREATTVQVQKSTHTRLTAAKPYDSMTYNEFIEQLLDYAEGNR